MTKKNKNNNNGRLRFWYVWKKKSKKLYVSLIHMTGNLVAMMVMANTTTIMTMNPRPAALRGANQTVTTNMRKRDEKKATVHRTTHSGPYDKSFSRHLPCTTPHQYSRSTQWTTTRPTVQSFMHLLKWKLGAWRLSLCSPPPSETSLFSINCCESITGTSNSSPHFILHDKLT